MFRTPHLLLGLVCSVALATSCSGAAEDPAGGPSVVAAFYPLAYAAERVGGARVAVTDLTPPGAEPHDLEPTADQVAALADADLVVYIGGGFQPSLEDVVSDSEPERVLDALALVGGDDPHLWLDPDAYGAVVSELAQRLGRIDPSGRDHYASAARALRAELDEVQRAYAQELSDCDRSAFVTSHDAFGRLAEAFDHEQIPIGGRDPEAEPTAGRLAEVADRIEAEGIPIVFSEELASGSIAETLARETGAAVDVLSPLEVAPEEGDLMDVMRANLTKLTEALGCG